MICRAMESAYREGRFEDGAIAGIDAINELLVAAFPARQQQRTQRTARRAGRALTRGFGALDAPAVVTRRGRSPVGEIEPMPPHDQQHVAETNRPNSMIAMLVDMPKWIIRPYRTSMTSTPMFSLKFCTAIECPAPISTWPRCCSRAFIGTTKNPAKAPMRVMQHDRALQLVHRDHHDDADAHQYAERQHFHGVTERDDPCRQRRTERDTERDHPLQVRCAATGCSTGASPPSR